MKGTMSSSRRTVGSVATVISDPDNGIVFEDNQERLYNPVNQKTPPPPMWGEVLEEDLYDPNTPFYDAELNQKLKEQREARIQHMLEQDK